MDKDKRKKILWGIAIVILLVALLFWVLRTSDQSPNTLENVNTPPPVFTPPSAELEYKPLDTVKETATEFTAANLAKSYVARFGSWSTDNQGTNLNELLPLSTSKMSDYIRGIKLDLDVDFSGTTTKSLSADIIDIDDDSAQVLVNTQKITTNSNLEKEVSYQEVEVHLLKSADKWLVDQVIWK